MRRTLSIGIEISGLLFGLRRTLTHLCSMKVSNGIGMKAFTLSYFILATCEDASKKQCAQEEHALPQRNSKHHERLEQQMKLVEVKEAYLNSLDNPLFL